MKTKKYIFLKCNAKNENILIKFESESYDFFFFYFTCKS